MQKDNRRNARRPTAIKALSALCIISGSILIAILVLREYVIAGAGLNFLSAATVAVISIVSIMLGYGIFSADKRSLLIIDFLIVVLFLVQLAKIDDGQFSGIYGIIICCIVLYSLTRKDIKRLFGFKIY